VAAAAAADSGRVEFPVPEARADAVRHSGVVRGNCRGHIGAAEGIDGPRIWAKGRCFRPAVRGLHPRLHRADFFREEVLAVPAGSGCGRGCSRGFRTGGLYRVPREELTQSVFPA
jgi:hypothetical protein